MRETGGTLHHQSRAHLLEAHGQCEDISYILQGATFSSCLDLSTGDRGSSDGKCRVDTVMEMSGTSLAVSRDCTVVPETIACWSGCGRSLL